jgi:DeoR family glycerol-3-phosphate regulon repressor
MIGSPRHSALLQALAAGPLSVSELAARLVVSTETIRRDLKQLGDLGEVVKTHGRAALSPRRGEAPFERRMREHAAAKQAIAEAVAGVVRDGDSVMLDTGTTTSYVARALLSRRGLTVVTNSSDVARTLAIANGNTVFMAGGQLRADNGAAFGAAAVEFVRRFKVRHAIISIGGLHATAGAMNFDLEEAEFGREVLACGDRRMIVTDGSKFGRSALVKVCGFGEFDTLVTEAPPPPDIRAALDANGADVLLPPGGRQPAPA